MDNDNESPPSTESNGWSVRLIPSSKLRCFEVFWVPINGNCMCHAPRRKKIRIQDIKILFLFPGWISIWTDVSAKLWDASSPLRKDKLILMLLLQANLSSSKRQPMGPKSKRQVVTNKISSTLLYRSFYARIFSFSRLMKHEPSYWICNVVRCCDGPYDLVVFLCFQSSILTLYS